MWTTKPSRRKLWKARLSRSKTPAKEGGGSQSFFSAKYITFLKVVTIQHVRGVVLAEPQEATHHGQ